MAQMTRFAAQALVATSLVAIAESNLAAQTIAGRSCDGCRVSRSLVATLGDPTDSVLLGASSIAQRLATGGFVAFSGDNSQLMVFDPSGKLVRVAGRRGNGPGEFEIPGSWAVGLADSIFVRQRGRIDVFAPDLRFVRSFPLTEPVRGINSLTQLGDGSIVGQWPSPGQSDFLHVMSPTGQHRRSFGATRLPAGRCANCQSRIVRRGPGGTEFIATDPGDFGVEVWTVMGALLRNFRVQSSWFPSGRREPSLAGSPPLPSIVGATIDSQGVLWVAGSVPNSEWKPPAGIISFGRGRATTITGNRPGVTESVDYSGVTAVIEAVDLATGASLATARFDREGVGMIPGGYAFTRRQDANGIVRLDIWRLVLERP